ncbi:unnamed protein product [Vitrella brassicaformis CCMP3155]|uniref:Photolyase/cryptochrome alpha/beta domain-containing protein n=2 Tax=Vitrella brassicaformis TaxID=1169539 RepID=A0A0G4G8N3_VITBC|nr:unnamed protein product [Vitrella brassicaformis CCMP3155]|eukprot:CEM24732.1 unnamed protein product [Vitrella brassicaformis CCMP3155]
MQLFGLIAPVTGLVTASLGSEAFQSVHLPRWLRLREAYAGIQRHSSARGELDYSLITDTASAADERDDIQPERPIFKPKNRIVVWFRNDLRVHDNPLLTAAADLLQQQGEDKVEVLPIYCITQQDLEPAPWEENPRLLARGRFLIEALTELKNRLRELGSDLLIVISDPHRFIPHLFNTRHETDPGVWPGPSLAGAVLSTKGVFEDENVFEDKLANELRRLPTRPPLQLRWDRSLYPIEEVADLYRRVGQPFTNVRALNNGVRRKGLTPPEPLPPIDKGAIGRVPRLEPFVWDALGGSYEYFPTTDTLPWGVEERYEGPPIENVVMAETPAEPMKPGGESGGLRLLEHYVWVGESVDPTDRRSHPVFNMGDSAWKIARWLGLGCVSPRLAWKELLSRQQETGLDPMRHWLGRELLIRDDLIFRYMAECEDRLAVRGLTPPEPIIPYLKALERIDRNRQDVYGSPSFDTNLTRIAAAPGELSLVHADADTYRPICLWLTSIYKPGTVNERTHGHYMFMPGEYRSTVDSTDMYGEDDIMTILRLRQMEKDMREGGRGGVKRGAVEPARAKELKIGSGKW